MRIQLKIILTIVLFSMILIMFVIYGSNNKLVSKHEQNEGIKTDISKIKPLSQKLNQEHDKLETNTHVITEPINKIHKQTITENKIDIEDVTDIKKEYGQYENEESKYSPQRVKLENNFLYEAIDYDYASVEEKKITKLIETDKYDGTTLRSSVCKTRLCKIIVEHKDDGVAVNFVDTIAEALRLKGESTMTISLDKEGKEITTLFYARSGKLFDN